MSVVEAIILDFDGVIVDSHKAHIEAWQLAYTRIFAQRFTQPERLIGKAGIEIAAELTLEIGAPGKARELYHLKSSLVHQAYSEIGLLPGAKEFMLTLQKLKVPYGIGSNARRAFIEKLIELHGLPACEIVGFDEVTYPKPHPEPFIMCASRLGIKKTSFHAVAVFDDSRIGIVAAKAAGMTPIGVVGQNNRDELVTHGAQTTVENLAEALLLGWPNNARI